MVEARENVRYCAQCYTLTDQELCPICSNSGKGITKTIMVVENTRDLAAYEKTGKIQRRVPCSAWGDLAHAWHRAGGYQVKRTDRALAGDVDEVIIATNSSLEGETTAMYISKSRSSLQESKVSRIASGVPVGGDLEYIDEVDPF